MGSLLLKEKALKLKAAWLTAPISSLSPFLVSFSQQRTYSEYLHHPRLSYTVSFEGNLQPISTCEQGLFATVPFREKEVRITILRHGKPDFDWRRNVKGSEFKALEREYDSAGVVGNPPAEILGLVPHHKYIVCSDLPRSTQSAKALGIDFIHHSSAIFREMNLPYFDNAPPYITPQVLGRPAAKLMVSGFLKKHRVHFKRKGPGKDGLRKTHGIGE